VICGKPHFLVIENRLLINIIAAGGSNEKQEDNMAKIIELANGKYLYMVDYNRIINWKIKDLFLAHNAGGKLAIDSLDMNEKILKKKVAGLTMLTLEVTQQCNLRCKYCVYNDNYENNRPFSSKAMTWETAKKGIDYIFSLIQTRKKKEFIIGFYGGEPLLNFPLIKKTVDYARKRFEGWDLSFNLTTNLTNMNSDILGYLIDQNIRLSISLDGDKHNHDAKRVFVDGRGTHDTIMENLQEIKDTDKEFYGKKISFALVHSFDLPLENALIFFEKERLVQDKTVRFANVNPFNTSYYDKYPWDKEAKTREIDRVKDGIFQRLKKKEPLSQLAKVFDNSIQVAAEFQKFRSHNTAAQTCLFDSRLLLDVEGNFHICEKMNQEFPIGDINKGLDFAAMLKILKDFSDLIEKECSGCDLKFMCTRCFALLADDGTFQIPQEFCAKQRKTIMNNLEKYIQYQEEGLIQ
jgi:uncharacterized protein